MAPRIPEDSLNPPASRKHRYEFQSGSRYLVYASDYNGGLYTGICSGTKAVESAAGEIAILRRLARSNELDDKHCL
jgi:hypothetical protein